MMFRAKHGLTLYASVDRCVGKAIATVKTWLARKRGGLPGEPSNTKGAPGRPPDCKHTRPKGHVGAPPRQIPGRQPGIEQTL